MTAPPGSWDVETGVAAQTGAPLGYVEQLYTFGDRDRVEDVRAGRALTVAYLALVREARPGAAGGAACGVDVAGTGHSAHRSRGAFPVNCA